MTGAEIALRLAWRCRVPAVLASIGLGKLSRLEAPERAS
jgi:hypothetical protein